MACTSAESALEFTLSPGNAHDAPEGRKLLDMIRSDDNHYVLMDKAYEDKLTREHAKQRGFRPVVPPKINRKKPWKYNKKLYRKRNEIERYIRRITRFRRVFTRYDKLDIIYKGVIKMAMILDAIIYVNTP